GDGRQRRDLDGVGLGPPHRRVAAAGTDGGECREAGDGQTIHRTCPLFCESIGGAEPPRKRSRTVGSDASSAASPWRSARPCTNTYARADTASASSAFCSTIRIATPPWFRLTIVPNSSSAARGL